jgi:carbon-monoxide dehydrogenase medium subunit
MKPPVFEYRAPATVGEALALLHEHGPAARVLAGGQSLVPLMNFRLIRPEYLIDINDLAELYRLEQFQDTLRLGAMTRHRELERRPEVRRHCPLLAQAARYIGHPQIRTRGTLGGSLAHADPSAELPAVAVALDATMVALSVRGERRIPAAAFFTFPFTTALADDELLTAVDFPVRNPNQGSAFLEVAARSGDFAAVGAAAVLELDHGGLIARARIVCSSVAPTPVRVPDAEALLLSRAPDGRLLGEIEALVSDSLQPPEDAKVSAGYRRRTAGVLVRRTIEQAWAMAQGRVE